MSKVKSKVNLKIYEEVEEGSQPITLKLIKDNEGVSIVNVDADGDTDNFLLTINNEGKVFFWSGIDETLGLPLDGDGELLVTEFA